MYYRGREWCHQRGKVLEHNHLNGRNVHNLSMYFCNFPIVSPVSLLLVSKVSPGAPPSPLCSPSPSPYSTLPLGSNSLWKSSVLRLLHEMHWFWPSVALPGKLRGSRKEELISTALQSILRVRGWFLPWWVDVIMQTHNWNLSLKITAWYQSESSHCISGKLICQSNIPGYFHT